MIHIRATSVVEILGDAAPGLIDDDIAMRTVGLGR